MQMVRYVRHIQTTGGMYMHRELRECMVCDGTYPGKAWITTETVDIDEFGEPCKAQIPGIYHSWSWETALENAMEGRRITGQKYNVYKSVRKEHRYCWVATPV